MDLVAGDSREILLALAVDDIASLGDRSRFDAHLALGGGTDPTWLDLFSEAVRTVTPSSAPMTSSWRRTPVCRWSSPPGARTTRCRRRL